MSAVATASPSERADIKAQARDEVVGLLVRKERCEDSGRVEQIRRWVDETSDRFSRAPIQSYVPILVEHIVRERMYQSPPST